MVLFLLLILFVIFYVSVYFNRNQSEQILILATLGLVETRGDDVPILKRLNVCFHIPTSRASKVSCTFRLRARSM